jgi:pimeloyl-ACP methyl ester carboxylesterase
LHKKDEHGRADYEVLDEFIEEHNVKRIGIVGISMGLPIAMEWFSSIVADAEAEGREIDWRIEEIISYSSPFDGEDPWKSDLLHWGAKSQYPGGLFSKFLYNLDFRRVFNPMADPEERSAALDEAINKTLNECSPQLFMSQVRLLAEADPSEWLPLLQNYADGVVFIYMIGELPDDVLDAEQAADRYFKFLSQLGNATLRLIVVAGAGHANTFLSANTLGELLLQEQAQAQDGEGEESSVALAGTPNAG